MPTLAGDDLVHMDRGSNMWVRVVTFREANLPRGSTEAIREVMSWPWFDYDGIGDIDTATRRRIHAGWHLDALDHDSYVLISPAQARGRLERWANEFGPDDTGAQSPAAVARLIRGSARATSTCSPLQPKSTATITVSLAGTATSWTFWCSTMRTIKFIGSWRLTTDPHNAARPDVQRASGRVGLWPTRRGAPSLARAGTEGPFGASQFLPWSVLGAVAAPIRAELPMCLHDHDQPDDNGEDHASHRRVARSAEGPAEEAAE